MPGIDKLAWIEVRERRVLFLRSRGKETFYSPGGKREGGESDQEALMREISEELVSAPESIRFLAEFSAQAHGKPEGVMVTIKCYAAAYEGELAPASEIEEKAWLSSADAEKTTIAGSMILQWLAEKDLID